MKNILIVMFISVCSLTLTFGQSKSKTVEKNPPVDKKEVKENPNTTQIKVGLDGDLHNYNRMWQLVRFEFKSKKTGKLLKLKMKTVITSAQAKNVNVVVHQNGEQIWARNGSSYPKFVSSVITVKVVGFKNKDLFRIRSDFRGKISFWVLVDGHRVVSRVGEYNDWIEIPLDKNNPSLEKKIEKKIEKKK